jgi:hypothetical protein
MGVDHEIIIEFNKMLLDHSDTLLKVAGGLAVVNLLLIAHMRHAHQQRQRVAHASLLVLTSAGAAGFSFIFGYFSNAAVLASMSNYANSGTWVQDKTAETFNLLQIIALAVGLGIFLFGVYFYRVIVLEALERVGLGGGG